MSSMYLAAYVMKLSISFFLCPGYNFLNKTRAWIADAVHSTYLDHWFVSVQGSWSLQSYKRNQHSIYNLESYSCSMTMSAKNSVGLSSWKDKNWHWFRFKEHIYRERECAATLKLLKTCWSKLPPTILKLLQAPKLLNHHFYSAMVWKMGVVDGKKNFWKSHHQIQERFHAVLKSVRR